MESKLKILFVEDLQTDVELAKRTLTKEGIKFQSRVVENETDFINEIEKFVPDLIISDYKMPAFNGMRALNITIEKCPNTPFILLTGSVNEEIAVECIKAGATDYVIKEHMARLPFAIMEAIEKKKQLLIKEKSEQALRVSELRFKQVSENAREWIWEVDKNGLYTYVSPIVKEMLGYGSEELVGKKYFYDLFDSEDREQIKKAALEAFARKEYFKNFINLNRHKDGREIILSTSGIPMLDSKGNLIGYRGVDIDITEQKRAEEELKRSNLENIQLLREMRESHDAVLNMMEDVVEARNTLEITNKKLVEEITERKSAEESLKSSEEKFNKAFQSSPVAMSMQNTEDIFVDVNTAFLNLIEYSRDEIIGYSGNKLCLWADDDERNRIHKHYSIHGAIKDIEFRFRRKSGTIGVGVMSSESIIIDGKTIALTSVLDITDRKHAEEKISMLAHSLRSINECVSITDIEDSIIFLNQSFLNTYGYTEEELIGKNINIVRSPNNLPELVREILPATLHGGWQGELWNKRKDGSEFPIYLSTTVINDKDGKPLGLIGVAQDITERKRSEEALQESEKKFRTVWASSFDGMRLSDSEGNIVKVNDSFCQMVEKDRLELEGSKISIIQKEGLQNHIVKIHQKRFKEKDIQKYFEREIELWNGNRKWFGVSNSFVELENGETLLLGIFRDITERRRAEQEIISQKNRFAQLFENSPIAIALLDDQDKIISINESFSILFGYFLEEIKGLDLDNIIVPPELKEEAKSYSDQTREGNQINKESYRKRKDGSNVFVQIIGVPVAVNDKTVGIYGMYVDLTQRKEAEDKMKIAKELAEQSDRLKSEFLAQMSHEIRTPINIMAGNVDYLKDLFGEKMNTEAVECFDGIDLASKRIIRTIDLILNVAVVQTSGYKPLIKQIDLNSDILNKLYQEHLLLAKQKGLELIYKCKLKETKILADEYSITQIFVNLIDNAIKYTKKGKVEILLMKNKTGNIVVEVKDTGIGMSKEFLPRIFEPFTQEDQGYTRSYDGSGLGLTLVKNYCGINDAIIEIESEKNVGSTFRVIIK